MKPSSINPLDIIPLDLETFHDYRKRSTILIYALAAGTVVVALKALLEYLNWEPIGYSSLYSTIITGGFFVIGFILSATIADYKESERFPSDFAAIDGSGNVYVADSDNDRVQKFDSSGTYLSQWGSSGSGDGQFDDPSGIAVDGSSVYVADSGNNRVQVFSYPDPVVPTTTVPSGVSDVNGDGIADIDQDNVTSFIDAVSGSYGVLESSCVRNEEVSSMVEPVGNSDSTYSYPSGLVNFSLACGTPGATATVTQYFYGLSDPSILVARKYDSVSHQYSTIENASITSTVVGGMTVVKVVYQITDGGSMDEDGTMDGNIVDPSGPAYVQSGSGSGSGGTSTSKTGKVPSFAKPRSGGIPSLAALQNAPSEEVSITKDRSLLKAPYSSEKVKAKESNAKLGDDHSDRNKNFLYTIGASVIVIFLSFGFRFWFARRRKKQEEQISELEVIKF